MRREPDFFGENELTLIHIAKKLKEALRVEETLTAAGVDYAVEADRYQGGVIFRTERVGAFFYVEPNAADSARRLLSERGFRLMG